MPPDIVRYIDRTSSESTSIEVGFNGGSTSPLGNPPSTQVTVRFVIRANRHWQDSPWIERWTYAAGDPRMPSGAWNGFRLTELIDGRVFVALGNELSEFDVKLGKPVWTVQTGNTPIRWIMKSLDKSGLIVFNDHFGFERDDQLSNITSIGLNGIEQWRTPRPSRNDIFSNHPIFNGAELSACSLFMDCTIDQSNGAILEEQFSK